MTNRIRYLKPDFFLDEDVAHLPPLIRLFFQGLWIHADRDGRLEDRPARLGVEIFPYEKNFEAEKALAILARPKRPGGRPFILRFETDGERYIQILSWAKHQRPHHTERASEIPAPPDNVLITVKEPLKNGAITGRNGDGDGDGDGESIGQAKARLAPLAEQEIDKKFSEFWAAYPQDGRHAKRESRVKFGALVKRGELAELIKGFNGYLDFLKTQKIKKNFDQQPLYAKTFLNDRWREFINCKYEAPL